MKKGQKAKDASVPPSKSEPKANHAKLLQPVSSLSQSIRLLVLYQSADSSAQAEPLGALSLTCS